MAKSVTFDFVFAQPLRNTEIVWLAYYQDSPKGFGWQLPNFRGREDEVVDVASKVAGRFGQIISPETLCKIKEVTIKGKKQLEVAIYFAELKGTNVTPHIFNDCLYAPFAVHDALNTDLWSGGGEAIRSHFKVE